MPPRAQSRWRTSWSPQRRCSTGTACMWTLLHRTARGVLASTSQPLMYGCLQPYMRGRTQLQRRPRRSLRMPRPSRPPTLPTPRPPTSSLQRRPRRLPRPRPGQPPQRRGQVAGPAGLREKDEAQDPSRTGASGWPESTVHGEFATCASLMRSASQENRPEPAVQAQHEVAVPVVGHSPRQGAQHARGAHSHGNEGHTPHAGTGVFDRV